MKAYTHVLTKLNLDLKPDRRSFLFGKEKMIFKNGMNPLSRDGKTDQSLRQ